MGRMRAPPEKLRGHGKKKKKKIDWLCNINKVHFLYLHGIIVIFFSFITTQHQDTQYEQ
jgi:hypothetical protein